MEIPVPESLRRIAGEIVARALSDADWAEIESDDMFQLADVSGGYDATESAFTFSVYLSDGRECWVQLTLEEVSAISRGDLQSVTARSPE